MPDEPVHQAPEEQPAGPGPLRPEQKPQSEQLPSPWPGWPALASVSAGGVLGALARYGLQTAFPHDPAGFAWATVGINVSGSLLIGVLMTLILELWPHRKLLRPFLGVGVLGGFTTFSTYAVDIQQALAADAAGIAMAYLAATLIGALLAVWAGVAVTARALRAAGIGGHQ